MILDTFYLLFKSDSSQAAKGIDELDKKIESLTAKGKKRSEQENKDLKDSLKQRKELNQNLKETEQLYEKITDNIVRAATSIFSFAAVSKGFLSTTENNSKLAIQGKLLGQSAKDLKAYGYAVESAGGDSEAFSNQIQKTSDEIFEITGKVPAATEVVKKLFQATALGRKQALETGDTSLFNFEAGRAGIIPAARPFFLQTEEEAEKSVNQYKSLAEGTNEAAESAREYGKALVYLKASIDSLFTSDSKILPFFANITNNLAGNIAGLAQGKLGKFINDIQNGNFEEAGRAYLNFRYGGGKSPSNSNNENLNETTDNIYNQDLFNTDKPTQSELVVNALKNSKNSLSAARNTTLGYDSFNSGSSKSYSVKTGDINVYTNATDAQGIARDASSEWLRQITSAISNLDDGVSH